MSNNSPLNPADEGSKILPSKKIQPDEINKKSTLDIKKKVLQLFAEMIQKQSDPDNKINSKQIQESGHYICSEPDYIVSNANKKHINPDDPLTSFPENRKPIPNLSDHSGAYSLSGLIKPSSSDTATNRATKPNILSSLSHPSQSKKNVKQTKAEQDVDTKNSNELSENLKNKNLKIFDEIIKSLEYKSNSKLPSHPLIKSNSISNDSSKPEKPNRFGLKNKFPRLPRRNLKPLDFSSIKNGSMSDKNYAPNTDTIFSSANSSFSSSGPGSEANSLYNNNGLLDLAILDPTQEPAPKNNLLQDGNNVDQRQKPFANIMKNTYDRMLATKKENQNELQKFIEERKFLIESLGLNLEPDPQNNGIVIGAPVLPELPCHSSVEIQNTIERAVYLTSEQNSNISNVYTLWNNNHNPVSIIERPPHFEKIAPANSSKTTFDWGPNTGSSSPHQIEICKYCQKSFKSLPKKQSHEQRCPSKLEAMLYSQPEIIETNDPKFSPSSQHLASLLESVPDYSESDGETTRTSRKPPKKRKLNTPRNASVPKNANLSQKPNASNKKNTKASAISLLSSKKAINAHPLNKQPSKLKNSKQKSKIVDSEDTMSLSEGSELSRFHGRDTSGLFFNTPGSNLVKNQTATSNNTAGTKNRHVSDFISLPFPQLQPGDKDGKLPIKTELPPALNSNGLNVNNDLMNLASEPPLPWNPDVFTFNPNDSNNSPHIMLSNELVNNIGSFDNKQQNSNVDLLSIINSLNADNSQNADILTSLLARNPHYSNLITSNMPITGSPNPKNSALPDNTILTPNASSSKKTGSTTSTKQKPKTPKLNHTVTKNPSYNLNAVANTSPFVGDFEFSPKNHGSSSTITLPQDNDDYQLMDDEPVISENSKTNSISANLNNTNLATSFATSNASNSNAISQEQFANSLFAFQNNPNFGKLSLDLNLLQNNAASFTSTPFMMGLDFNSMQSPSIPASAPLTAPLSAFPTINDGNAHKNTQSSGLTPAKAKNSCHSDASSVSKRRNSVLSTSENKPVSSNLTNINQFSSLQNQPDPNGNSNIMNNANNNSNISQLFALDLLNGSLEGQISLNDLNSLFLSPSQTNLIDWNTGDENIDREFEGMINFD